MTISTTTRKIGPYDGDGIVDTFPFTFKAFGDSDLLVVRLNVSTGAETVLTLTTDYTVTRNADQNNNPGGQIVLTTPLAVGTTLTITTVVANLQPTDLTNQGGFYPQVITDALDRATIQIQQLQEETDRSIKYPLSIPATVDAELPFPAADSFLRWNAAGTAITNHPGQGTTTVAWADIVTKPFIDELIAVIPTTTASALGFTEINMLKGGQFKVSPFSTFTVDVPFTAGPFQVFTGTGTVVFAAGSVAEVLPQWWGAKGDGVTDDSSSINKAVTAISPAGGVVKFAGLTYALNGQIVLKSHVILEGSGIDNTILLATPTFDAANPAITFTSLIRHENMVGDYGGASDRNIGIRNMTIDSNGQDKAGIQGVVQFRGLRHGFVRDVKIDVDGSNCWGIILFGSNKYIDVRDTFITNTSPDGSDGGCLWVRGFLAAGGNDEKRTYGVTIDGCTFWNTAIAECVAVDAGLVDGTEVDFSMSNCYIRGLAAATLPGFLLVLHAKQNNSKVRAKVTNTTIVGKSSQYAVLTGFSGISAKATWVEISNCTLDLEAGGGILNWDVEKEITNCTINVPNGVYSAFSGTLVNCKMNRGVYASRLIGCFVEVPAGATGESRSCAVDSAMVQNCRLITNAASGYGVITFGAKTQTLISNNFISARTKGIYLQNDAALVPDKGLISGNFIRRPGTDDNTGTIGIHIIGDANTQFNLVNNMTLTLVATGVSAGFATHTTLAGGGTFNQTQNIADAL